MYVVCNDIALVNESRNHMNVKLVRQQETLESKDIKISHTKTDCMNCNFSKDAYKAEMQVRIETQEMIQRYSFLYFGLIISK